MEDAADTSTSSQDGNQTSGDTSAAGDEFKAITSQEDLNRILDERLKRERAKFADYKDVKAKASRLDEIEQANKSEIDKAIDRVAKAEAEVATVPAKVADALRTHLVAMHEIDADDAELFLTADDPELLLKQVTRLLGQSDKRKKNGNHVPREGATPPVSENEERAFARELFAP